MSYTENDDKPLDEEIVEVPEVKIKKKSTRALDPEYNTKYYHRTVKNVTCEICSCIVSNKALYDHKKTKKCLMIRKIKEEAKNEYEELKKKLEAQIC